MLPRMSVRKLRAPAESVRVKYSSIAAARQQVSRHIGVSAPSSSCTGLGPSYRNCVVTPSIVFSAAPPERISTGSWP